MDMLSQLMASFGGGMIQNVQDFGRQRIQAKDNLELWKIQQAYNTPAKQIERLKEAKLSPHLVFGHGSAVNTASSAPAPIDYAAAHRGSQQGLDILTQLLQAEKIKSEIKNIDQNTLYQGVQTDLQQVELKWRDASLGMGLMQQQQGMKLIQAQVDQTKALTATEQQRLLQVVAQTAGIKIDNLQKQKLFPLTYLENVKRIYQIEAATIQTRALTSKIPYEKTALQAQAKEIYARIRNINQDTALKTFSVSLSQLGLSTNDPLYLRLLAGQAAQDGILGDIINSINGSAEWLGTRLGNFFYKKNK